MMSENMQGKNLRQHENNKYSQCGEDGVIREILNRLSGVVTLDKWCVEFGAWDGIHLSNTCRLIREEDYRAVLIEGNKKKFKELCNNFPEPKIVKRCEFVDFHGPKSLENILLNTEIPADFDFLSIDIDGNDYHILKSLSKIHPKVICIEFNGNIPNEVSFVQQADFRVNVGSSAKALIDLAQTMDYVFVHATTGNLFFVREELANTVLNGKNPNLEDMVDDTANKTFIFVGMDGSLHTSQPVWMPWHKLRITERGLQVLPPFLIRFRSDYNLLQKLAFYAFRAFSGKVKKEKRL